jgi:hypothetical protein
MNNHPQRDSQRLVCFGCHDDAHESDEALTIQLSDQPREMAAHGTATQSTSVKVHSSNNRNVIVIEWWASVFEYFQNESFFSDHSVKLPMHWLGSLPLEKREFDQASVLVSIDMTSSMFILMC